MDEDPWGGTTEQGDWHFLPQAHGLPYPVVSSAQGPHPPAKPLKVSYDCVLGHLGVWLGNNSNSDPLTPRVGDILLMLKADWLTDAALAAARVKGSGASWEVSVCWP